MRYHLIVRDIKGQGVLEFCVVFIIFVLFLFGIAGIWFWSNGQFVDRQKRYNETRVIAGTARDNYVLEWPVYTPPELTEDDVLMDSPFQTGD